MTESRSSATSETTADQTLSPTARLVKIGDAGMMTTDPSEDVRGRKVIDKHGEEVGDVDDLLIDDQHNKVRFLRVAAGGFLGLGETKFLIPVDAVARVTEDTVHIDQTREHVAGGPRYDPDLTEDYTQYAGYYGYYGYSPFWTPGYMYPMFPYIGGGRIPPRVPR